mmetsp:Transcript_23151/g.38281  ORF Transcript_23151/g.38281 Transcript_23151/m.38281 type:complete len:246 (+) Transcript_23151:38-775(+)|eukprot:CAMPEP_0119332032 /NCGR_PEP_ID=MMETSP1333-20130426/81896_1 /TAXON_ID=418940 /ORGANISM="Scyphosphaera apsteinii, Strain RCC1455" /LENGTH=245 /DNA_ID=CAMNT_0007341769 /DNA_START=37 /DNA_END=774 /DNA_ORIENTATION=-
MQHVHILLVLLFVLHRADASRGGGRGSSGRGQAHRPKSDAEDELKNRADAGLSPSPPPTTIEQSQTRTDNTNLPGVGEVAATETSQTGNARQHHGPKRGGGHKSAEPAQNARGADVELPADTEAQPNNASTKSIIETTGRGKCAGYWCALSQRCVNDWPGCDGAWGRLAAQIAHIKLAAQPAVMGNQPARQPSFMPAVMSFFATFLFCGFGFAVLRSKGVKYLEQGRAAKPVPLNSSEDFQIDFE